MSPSQAARALEVDRYLAEQYAQSGFIISATTQTYLGDIVDWVDADSVPGSREEPPPPIEWDPGEGPLSGMELVDYPELRGPVDSIPFYRPTYQDYVFQDELEEFDPERFSSIHAFIDGQQSGQPATQYRLYGGYRMVENSRGIWMTDANLSTWEQGIVYESTFSLFEINAVCDGPQPGDQDLIGAAASRDRANFGDPSFAPNRVQVEIYHKTHDHVGEFSRWAQAPYVYWVPSATAPYSPGAAHSSISTIDGTQFDYRFHWELVNGNWWFAHNGNWLGYYPASLLTFFKNENRPSMTGSHVLACRTSWYGEVFDPTPTTWTPTDMGSGRHALQGWQKAAYIRRPYYGYGGSSPAAPYAQGTGAAGDSPGVGTGGVIVGPADAACYTTSAMFNGGANWERYFYLGGPGGGGTCN